jgi:hypothetical protein
VKPKYVEVHPVHAAATSEDPSHPAASAIDGKSNTYWSVANRAPNGGVGQSITVTFNQPVTVTQLGFTVGAIDKPEDFLTQPRPSTVHVVLSGTGGAVVASRDITLPDDAKFHTFHVTGRNVTTIQTQITGINQAAQGGGHQVSIAELEYFKTT